MAKLLYRGIILLGDD